MVCIFDLTLIGVHKWYFFNVLQLGEFVRNSFESDEREAKMRNREARDSSFLPALPFSESGAKQF